MSELKQENQEQNLNALKINPLTKKVQKVLESHVENDKETLEALKELSAFFKENTINSRRNLRGEIERRSLIIKQEVLAAFKNVKEALDAVENDAMSLDKTCKEMSARLQATKTQTHHLLDQMAEFQSEKQNLKTQREIATALLTHLQLKADEVAVLRGTGVKPDLDDLFSLEFFAALEKAQTLHRNCRLILQNSHQATALEIMDQMALYQEAALERLYRWTQAQCKNVEAPQTGVLTQAMGCLQDRPVLLKYVLEEYCTSRRAMLVRAFLDALTIGGANGGVPRPIELHAHDPMRYVGDMLAWLHQMAPNEKENIQALLKGCDRIDVSEAMSSALANITEGVCRPLKSRIEQVLAADPGAPVLRSLNQLMRFYHQTIGQVLQGSPLLATIAELQDQCYSAFLVALDNAVHKVLERADSPKPDLAPSSYVTNLVAFLKEVFSGGRVIDNNPYELSEVVSRIIDPLLTMVHETASRLPLVDKTVYTLNCLYYIHSILSLYEFMDARLDALQEEMETQLKTLSSEQASSLIHNLGLGSVCTLLQGKNPSEPLLDIPGMEPSNLKNFVAKLENYLANADLLPSPQWRLLSSAGHRSIVQTRALDAVMAIYRQLYNAVHDPASGYSNPSSIMPCSPEQIQALLA
nr:EOG090X03SX [Triops cancriformis]